MRSRKKGSPIVSKDYWGELRFKIQTELVSGDFTQHDIYFMPKNILMSFFELYLL